MLRAGAAEIDITPEVGNLVPGQWLRRVAESVMDPLQVNALVLESGDTRVAMVSADALSLKNSVVAEARNLARHMSGIAADNIFLHATHTHAGPPVSDGLGTESQPEFVSALANAIAAAIASADRSLRPVRIAPWSGVAPNLAFPRRYHMRDGTVLMHPPKDSPDLLGPEDQADPTIAGFHVWSDVGELVATAVNFACHPIVVGSVSAYSADYPGGVRRALKRFYGSDSVVLYMNGPCGDIGPDNVADKTTFRHGPEWLDRIGGGIAGHAIGVASVAGCVEETALAASSSTVSIPVRPVPAEVVEEAKSRLTDDDIAVPPQDVELIKLREALLIDRDHGDNPFVEAEVMAMRIGELVMVGLPGEVFTEFGRRVRAASPFPHTMVVGLANGCHGYVPIPSAFDGGGYETWLARSSKLGPEAGDLMVEAAGQVLADVTPRD